MLILHEPLDVPLVEEPPRSDEDWLTVDFPAYLLTVAIRQAPAMLDAIWWQAPPTFEVEWLLRSRAAAFEDRLLYRQPARYFRNTLAQFGHRFMADQLYGGSVRRRLRQGDRAPTGAIHMANDGPTGFWIRISTSSPW